MTKFVPTKFNIIRRRGDPQKATIILINGEKIKVERLDALFDPNRRTFIKCAPYDDHFIFELPKHVIGPTWQCTCGSIAVAVEYDVLKHDTSVRNALIVCMTHVQSGLHLTGGSRWI